MKVLIKCQTVIEEHLGTHTECVYLIHLAALLPFEDAYESSHACGLFSPLLNLPRRRVFYTLKVIPQDYRVQSAAQAN